MFYNYRRDGLSEKGMGTTVTVLGVKLTEPRLDQEGVRGDGDATLVVEATTTLKLQQSFVMSDELVAKYMANELASVTEQRNKLLEERSRVGLAIDAAIRDGVVPDEHPLRSRLEMLANHRLREQDLRAEVERVNNQINEMPGMDAFDEIDRLRAECGNWEMALGTVLATIPVKEITRATGTVGDAVAYFKQLHQQRDKLMTALQDARGALSSVNSGHQHQITVNDEPAYWQTGEWVRWILDEVLPGVDAAINTTKAE